MIYTREIDYVEMVYRLKYAFSLSQKTQLMNKDQIVQLKRQRKFLKEQLKLIDKLRADLTQNSKVYQLV